EEIACHLSTRPFGRALRTLKTVDSTQKVAHRWPREGAPGGAAAIADARTGGRGRLGRCWHSAPGWGIGLRLIVGARARRARAPQLTLMASVGIARALIDMTHLPVRIKWPNDLLIRDKKVCGILTELRGEQDRVHYAVLGAGINVNIDGEAW